MTSENFKMTDIKPSYTAYQRAPGTAVPRSQPLMPAFMGLLFGIAIYWMLTNENGTFQDVGAGFLLIGSAILILRRPYWGVILTLVSLPLTELIYQSSLTQYYLLLVGGLTVVSCLMHNLHLRRFQGRGIRTKKTYSAYIWALLFLLWTFSTNPQAALFEGDRIWLLTLVQLFLLTWLAGELFDTPDKQRLLMLAFVLSSTVSAGVALQQAYIGDSFGTSLRATGLAGGANTTVRLFIYALVMLSFLLHSTNTRFAQLAGVFGIAILAAGVVATVSRTGFLLLIIALAMIFWDELTKRIKASMLLGFMAVVLIAYFWIPDSYWIFMLQDAPVKIMEGTDTIGFRYQLWQAAWQMWQDYPVAGVGIGQFASLSPVYGASPAGGVYFVGAHSIYFGLLAENGIVGLIFYLGLMVSTAIALIRVVRNGQGEWRGIARTWLFVFLLIMVGGITKHDQYDKFPWLIPGLALAIGRAFYQEHEAE